MKKLLTGALLALAMVCSTVVGYAAPSAAYSGPYYATITGNGRVGPFPTYGQSVCGFTLANGTGTLTATVGQSIDGQLFSTLGSPLTGLANGAQYSWSVLPNPPTSQALTSGAAGVSANQITVSAFSGTPMNLVFACTSSPLAVTPSSIGAVASVTSAGAPIFTGGTATNPTVGLTTPLTVPFGGTGVASPNPIFSPPLQSSGTWPNLTIQDLSHPTNLVNQGAVCDGSSDDKAVINAATFPVQVPFGSNCKANEAVTALPGGFFSNYGGGDTNGHLITVESAQANNRAHNIAVINAPPSCTNYTIDQPLTGFNCDMKYLGTDIQTYINSGAGCGPVCPTDAPAAYQRNPTMSQWYGITVNNAGYQGWVNGAKGGRTDVSGVYHKMINNGNGDATSYVCVGFSNGIAPSPTTSPLSWTGDPAVECLQAQLTAGADHQYLHFGDWLFNDQGHDDTTVGLTFRLDRTGAAAGYNVWEGITFQTDAAANLQVDSDIAIRNNATIGIDLTNLNYLSPSPAPAIAMKSLDSIRLNCTNSGTNGKYSRYTTCPDTGISHQSGTGNVEIHNAGTISGSGTSTGWLTPALTDSGIATGNWVQTTTGGLFQAAPSPSPLATATACGAAVSRSGSWPNTTINVPVCPAPAVLYETTGQTSLALVSPQPSPAPLPCGTGATSSCSGGALTINTAVSNGATGKWLVTVEESLDQGGATTAAFTTGCVAYNGSAYQSRLDYDNGNTNGGVCQNAITNNFMGVLPFGDNAATLAGLHSRGTAHVLVNNNSSFSITCYVGQSAVVAVTVYGWCSMKAEPI